MHKNGTFICKCHFFCVPLQALQMTKVLHISKKSCTFATEIEMTDVKSTNVLVRQNIKTLWQRK